MSFGEQKFASSKKLNFSNIHQWKGKKFQIYIPLGIVQAQHFFSPKNSPETENKNENVRIEVATAADWKVSVMKAMRYFY